MLFGPKRVARRWGGRRSGSLPSRYPRSGAMGSGRAAEETPSVIRGSIKRSGRPRRSMRRGTSGISKRGRGARAVGGTRPGARTRGRGFRAGRPSPGSAPAFKSLGHRTWRRKTRGISRRRVCAPIEMRRRPHVGDDHGDGTAFLSAADFFDKGAAAPIDRGRCGRRRPAAVEERFLRQASAEGANGQSSDEHHGRLSKPRRKAAAEGAFSAEKESEWLRRGEAGS